MRERIPLFKSLSSFIISGLFYNFQTQQKDKQIQLEKKHSLHAMLEVPPLWVQLPKVAMLRETNECIKAVLQNFLENFPGTLDLQLKNVTGL